MRGENKLKPAINNAEIDAYIFNFVYVALAFLILSVIGFLIFFIEFVCCACDKFNNY